MDLVDDVDDIARNSRGCVGLKFHVDGADQEEHRFGTSSTDNASYLVRQLGGATTRDTLVVRIRNRSALQSPDEIHRQTSVVEKRVQRPAVASSGSEATTR